jgi:hypothetical protein
MERTSSPAPGEEHHRDGDLRHHERLLEALAASGLPLVLRAARRESGAQRGCARHHARREGEQHRDDHGEQGGEGEDHASRPGSRRRAGTVARDHRESVPTPAKATTQPERRAADREDQVLGEEQLAQAGRCPRRARRARPSRVRAARRA